MPTKITWLISQLFNRNLFSLSQPMSWTIGMARYTPPCVLIIILILEPMPLSRPSPSRPHKPLHLGLTGLEYYSDVISHSLANLNAKLFHWNDGEKDSVLANDCLCMEIDLYSLALTLLLPPLSPAPSKPTITLIGTLTSSLMDSDNKLFFISHRIPGFAVTEWALV